MSYGIERKQALELLEQHIENPNLVKHCLASEAVLRSLAERLGGDPEKWGLAGLLHDLDAEITKGDFGSHGRRAAEMLSQRGLDPEIVEAIHMHNETAADRKRSAKLEHALAAGETITGLITATALVYPDKKLASVKPKSITKRMRQKAFAASVNRDTILECEQLGLALADFADLALRAMQGISDRLGL